MATRKPSPAQLEARRLFAERARSGELASERSHHRAAAKRTKAGKASARKVNPAASTYRGKYPNRIKSVSGSRATPGEVIVTLNSGERTTLSARETGGVMPMPGEELEKYTMPRKSNPSKPIKGSRNLRWDWDARDADQGIYSVHEKTGKGYRKIADFRDYMRAKEYGQAYADAHGVTVKITGNLA